MKLCISYVLRRAICEIPTNSMNKTFATLKNYIRPDDYMNSVKAFFVISINMKFSEINDPNGICKDITGLGRWGNGDVELFMEHQDELDQIMEIVKQSFDAQAE